MPKGSTDPNSLVVPKVGLQSLTWHDPFTGLTSHSIAQALSEALARGEFYLCYQPIFDLDRQIPIALEALIRWRHPTVGTIYPGDFIDLAERMGLITTIGTWVLSMACLEFKRLLKRGFKLEKIYVNVSSHQMLDDFPEIVQKILHTHKLKANCLGIEITETAILEPITRVNNMLEYLQKKGISIAIDDFGMGYFSFHHLKHFPFDLLKIDRSFVAGIGSNAMDDAIVNALLSLVRNLNIDVIAEGIETGEQLRYLQQWQCPQGQGFYFARPMELEQTVNYLEQF